MTLFSDQLSCVYGPTVYICMTLFSDQLSCVYGPTEEHDFPLWTRHLSDVWRSNGRVPNLQETGGKTHPSVLDCTQQQTTVHERVA
jgi:hypothetical protein